MRIVIVKTLYKEIARANNHPEWEGQVRDTFAQRWTPKSAIRLVVSGCRRCLEEKNNLGHT